MGIVAWGDQVSGRCWVWLAWPVEVASLVARRGGVCRLGWVGSLGGDIGAGWLAAVSSLAFLGAFCIWDIMDRICYRGIAAAKIFNTELYRHIGMGGW